MIIIYKNSRHYVVTLLNVRFSIIFLTFMVAIAELKKELIKFNYLFKNENVVGK